MSENAKCPNCGKYNIINTQKPAWQCENCGAAFRYDSSSVFKKYQLIEDESDYVVVDGVLVKYQGNDIDLHIPENVSEIGERAFKNSTSVHSVYLPDTVRIIGKEAFYGCIRLEEINFPANTSYIGEKAFDGCVSLFCVDLPSTLSSSGTARIGVNAFSGCVALVNIRVSNRIRSVHDHIFDNCNENVFFEWDNLNNNANCCDVIHQRVVNKKCIHCGGELTGFFVKKCNTCQK